MVLDVLYCLRPKHVTDAPMGFPSRTLADRITNPRVLS